MVALGGIGSRPKRGLAQVLAAADPDLPPSARGAARSERAGLAVGAREAGDPVTGRSRPPRSELGVRPTRSGLVDRRRFARGQVTVSVARSIANSSLAIVPAFG